MIRVQSLTFFKMFICNTLLQLFTISRIITATTTVVPFCFQGHLWGGFPSTKNFSRPFNTMILVSFYAFLLFNRFLHAQIIIFVVAYWEACDISWKWYTTVNICLFHILIFDFLFKPATMNLTKAETLQLGSTTG